MGAYSSREFHGHRAALLVFAVAPSQPKVQRARAQRHAGWLLWGLASSCTVIDLEPPDDAVFSEGCGTASSGASEGPGPFSLEIDVAGETRRYLVRYPGSYSADFPYPLVFALHGAGGNGAEVRAYTEIESVSRAQAIYVYPDAAEVSPGFTAWNPSVDSPDLEFIQAVRDDVQRARCVDTSRVFVLGFSSGAAMANAVACYAKDIRGVAAIAGRPASGACRGPVAAWIAHDRNDTVVDFRFGEDTRDTWRATNGCSDQSEPFEVGPCELFTCEGAPVVWCPDDQPASVAHTWPVFATESLWQLFSDL